MCFTSAFNCFASAIPKQVLPVPGGPTNSQALLYGACKNLLKIRLGLSRPTNSSIVAGWYFSLRACGKAKPSCSAFRTALAVTPSNKLICLLRFPALANGADFNFAFAPKAFDELDP